MLNLFRLFICVIFSSLALRGEESWKEYTNARFGFRLSYPGTLEASREPDNGDGREFHTPNKEFSVVAVGHFLMTDDGDSLEKRWNEELKTLGTTVTYKKKAATWYVVSGITKDGTEYYNKLYTKDDRWAAFRITYPHAKNKKYDPWVAKIEKSFIPFFESGIDRIQK